MNNQQLIPISVYIPDSGETVSYNLEADSTVEELKVMVASRLYTNPELVEFLHNRRLVFGYTRIGCLNLFHFFIFIFTIIFA